MKPVSGNNSLGFTLLEMVMVVAISSMIAYAIFAVMRTGQEQTQSAQTRMTVYDGAREGLYKVIQEIRSTAPDRISITNGGTRIQIDVPDPSNPINGDFTINWNSASQIAYALGGANGTQLIRTQPDGSTSVIANDVVALNFTGNAANPSVVTVSMSVQRALVNGRLIPQTPLQLTGQAEIRNE